MKDSRRKRATVTFLILLLVGSVVCAEQIKLFVGKGHNYDDVTKGLVDVTYRIIYNTESDEYYFYTSDSVTSGWIVFDEIMAEKFYNNLLKYQEWEVQALDLNVAIQKELPDSRLMGDVRWTIEGESHSGEGMVMNFVFLSQSEEVHQLVITTTTVDSAVAGSSFCLEPLYLTSEQVASMVIGFSPEAIKKILAVYSNFK